MINFLGIPIDSNEVIHFLKTNFSLRDTCQEILHQRLVNQVSEDINLLVTPEEVQAEADRFRHKKRLEKASDTLEWLNDQMITISDLEESIHNQLLRHKLAESLFSKEVEKYFIQNRLDFDQVLLYQIIVPYKKVAQELFYQIEEGEISFYEAAHLYDVDEQRRYQCGYEGKIDRWSFKPDIAALVFSAQPNTVVGPVETEAGFHLLMVEEFIPAELTSGRYQDILDKMFEEWLTGELNHMIHHRNH